MYIPTKIDIGYLIDAAENTSVEDDIPRHVPYILYEEAQKTLLDFIPDKDTTSCLEDRVFKGFKRLSGGKEIPNCPEDYKENDSKIQELKQDRNRFGDEPIKVLVEFYKEYHEKYKIDELRKKDEEHTKRGTLSANFQELEGESARRERILTTSKALRTALKMLTLVERGETSEELFIQEKDIRKEFLQDTEYDGHTNRLPIESSSTAAANIQASCVNANMDVPISKIDVENLIYAVDVTSGEDNIPEYIPYKLYEEAQKALGNLKKQVQELEERMSILSSIKAKGIPKCPEGEGYSENDSTIQVLVKFYPKYNEEWGTSSANFQALESVAMRERYSEHFKVLRAALKLLSRVERGETSEEDFIRENGIPEEFVKDTEYDEG